MTHRPSGTMCTACKNSHTSCGWLDFTTMPVMRKDKDGMLVVRCSEFAIKVPPAPTHNTLCTDPTPSRSQQR